MKKRILQRDIESSKIINSSKNCENQIVSTDQLLMAEVIESTKVGTWQWNVQTGETVFSERWAEIIGYSLEELSPVSIETWMRYAHPDDLAGSNELLQRHFNGELDYYEYESRMLHKNGDWVWVIDRGRVISRTTDGKPLWMLGSHQDITERKREKQLLEMRIKLIEYASGHSLSELMTKALDEIEVFLNSKISFLHFVLPDQKTLSLQQWSTATAQKFCKILERGLHYGVEKAGVWAECLQKQEGVIHNDYKSLPHKKGLPDGHAEVIREMVVPVQRNGLITAIIGVGNKPTNYSQNEMDLLSYLADNIWEVIERKQAEESLRNSQEKYRLLTEFTADVIWVLNLTSQKFTYISPSIYHLRGLTPEEAMNETLEDALTPESVDIVKKAIEVNSNEFIVHPDRPNYYINEIQQPHRDGRLIWVEVSTQFRYNKDGEIEIVGVSRNIEARRETENALKQLSTRLSLATRAGRVGVWDYDTVNNILIWDDEMYRLYGIDEKNFIGEYDAWRKGLHPDDLRRGDEEIQMALSGEKEFDTEFRVVWPDGTIHNIRAIASVQRDESGNPLRMVGTNWDITDQKNNEATLLKAKNDADAANRAKSEFLANMSHEIRTPLNGVIGFTDLLKKTPLNEIQKQYCENANTSGKALLGIINDILDFSKIEAGRLELDIIETDIFELAEQASDIIKYHAGTKNLELLLNIQPDLPRIAALDPVRLKQILTNLLSNAIKFTETGEVELRLTFDPIDKYRGRYHFSIRDTGIGIKEEQKKKLFKAFSQADSSTTRKYGGTGLGLIISNLLAQKMGSSIGVDSTWEVGSTFYFSIETDYRHKELFADCPPESLPVKSVLVIDDNANNRQILRDNFKYWKIDFYECADGLSALKMIEENRFDLLIVDYHMPEIDGLDTIRMIRDKFSLTLDDMPVILLHSSSDDQYLRDECRKLGVRFNLVKPVKADELYYFIMNIHKKENSGQIESGENNFGYSKNKNEKNRLIEENREDRSEDANILHSQRPVIVIAEDVEINMILVRAVIEDLFPGAVILEAIDGQKALELTVSNKVDLVLMDVQMPIMGGIEATKKIREWERDRGNKDRLPIVALTAGALKEEHQKTIDCGMDDFLTKPIDSEKLKACFSKYLNKVT